jgi:hypothetical protein
VEASRGIKGNQRGSTGFKGRKKNDRNYKKKDRNYSVVVSENKKQQPLDDEAFNLQKQKMLKPPFQRGEERYAKTRRLLPARLSGRTSGARAESETGHDEETAATPRARGHRATAAFGLSLVSASASGDEPMTMKDDNQPIPIREQIDAIIAQLTEGEHDDAGKQSVERLRETWRKTRELIEGHDLRVLILTEMHRRLRDDDDADGTVRDTLYEMQAALRAQRREETRQKLQRLYDLADDRG